MKQRRAKKPENAKTPTLTSRSKLSEAEVLGVLRRYAERKEPQEAATATGLSRNTIYLQYERIRWRLIMAAYYTDAARSPDEDGLSPALKKRLRARRGITKDNVFAQAAELIFWAEEWPPKLVLKHIKRIIALTGSLDRWPELTEEEAATLEAYVRFARTELVHHRAQQRTAEDATMVAFAERAQAALEQYRREYRTALKRLERSG